MKTLFLILLALGALGVKAQDKKERDVIGRTYLLSHTVFGTKDSATLEDLFARKATYGHSHGNLQTREEAIRGITRNQSVYRDTAVKILGVVMGDDVAI